MPYIDQKAKESLRKGFLTDPGRLNYSITKLLNDYVNIHLELNYQVINDIMGALEGAKLEFYRRVAVPYEEEKMAENGDVYENEKEKKTRAPIL